MFFMIFYADREGGVPVVWFGGGCCTFELAGLWMDLKVVLRWIWVHCVALSEREGGYS